MAPVAGLRPADQAHFLADVLLNCMDGMAAHSPSSSSHWHEVLLGRSLAACAHPMAAWQAKARSFRVLLLGGYFLAGYIAVLAAMALI